MTSVTASYSLRFEAPVAPLQGEDPQVTLWTNTSWSFHADKAQRKDRILGRCIIPKTPPRNLFKMTNILKHHRAKTTIIEKWKMNMYNYYCFVFLHYFLNVISSS